MSKYYGVHIGRKPGVYYTWPECKAQIRGYSGNKYKSFPTYEAAEVYYKTGGDIINPPRFYAVAKGHQPGIYSTSTWNDVEGQVKRFSGARCKGFETKAEAVEYIMTWSDLRPEDIKVFSTHWDQYKGFVPRPRAPFLDEYHRLAESQGWTPNSREFKRQKAIVFSDELKQQFFAHPDYPTEDEEEDDNTQRSCFCCDRAAVVSCPNHCKGIFYCSKRCLKNDVPQHKLVCDDTYWLRGYQNLCRKIPKPVGDTEEECIAILKGRPWVNIVDFVDACRTGQDIETWYDWAAFKRYTLRGKCISLEYAKNDKLLESLLQDFTNGPDPDTLKTSRDGSIVKEEPGNTNERVLKRVRGGRVKKAGRTGSAVSTRRRSRRASSGSTRSDRSTYSDDASGNSDQESIHSGSSGSNRSMDSDDGPASSDEELILSDSNLQLKREELEAERQKWKIWRQTARRDGRYTRARKAKYEVAIAEIERDEQHYGL